MTGAGRSLALINGVKHPDFGDLLDFMGLLGFQTHEKYKRVNNFEASNRTDTSYIMNFNCHSSYDSSSANFKVEDSRNTRTVQRFFVN